MNRPLIRRLPTVLAALGVALFLATAAIGATPTTITLNLQGGYSNQDITKCGDLHHFTMYHVNKLQSMNGTVSPNPPYPDGQWKVKIKVEKCVLTTAGPTWKVIQQVHVLGNTTLVNGTKTAVYQWTHKLLYRGFYFVRSYYYTSTTTWIQSTDEHYHVTY